MLHFLFILFFKTFKFIVFFFLIIGLADELVIHTRSEALASKFKSATVVSHPGGHYIPTKSEYARQYRSFFQQFMEEAQEDDDDETTATAAASAEMKK